MTRLLLTLFILTWAGCINKQSPYKGLKLPDNKEYNQVIFEIIKQDTITEIFETVKSEFISEYLTKPNIGLVRSKPQTFNGVVVIDRNDLRTSISELNFYEISDSLNLKTDSLYFAFQNDSAKQIIIDSKIINSVKFATKELIIENESNRKFGYLQFSLPVFNSKRSKAFVKATFVCHGNCGAGFYFILEKINNKWTLILAERTWVG